MNDQMTLLKIKDLMSTILMAGNKPVRNTTKKECYEALQGIYDVLFRNKMWHMYQAAEAFQQDYRRMFSNDGVSEDIQHVGYDEEQCGRTK